MLTPCFALVSSRDTCSPAAGVQVGPFWLWNRRPLLLRGEPASADAWRFAQNRVQLLERPDEPWAGTVPTPSRRAAVLCPGPSLRKTWPAACGEPSCPCQDGDPCHYEDYDGKPAMRRPFDTVLCVNAAADHADPDWVVSSKREPPWSGSEGTFITTGSHPERFAKPERDQVGTHPTTAAVALAAWLGHGVVTVYGDDRGGAQHFDGSPSHDSPGRWLREGAAFDALVWNLAQVGCDVERVLP